MSNARTLSINLQVGVYDVDSLHAAAVKAYCHGDESLLEDAYDLLGPPEDPILTACLIELWTEICPAEAGYEFHTWQGRDT